jgi:geranylgeranyl pyrophosphate synthase
MIINRANGPAPDGPEPFGMVANELQPLSDYVKELVKSENPVLTMAASHFFDQRQGKRFRPTIVALMALAVSSNSPEIYGGVRIKEKQLQLGQITEMIHVASLIHDDVLDEADIRRGGASVHTMYTNKVAVLAGDYLLARASVLLARLQHFQVVEVMASALDALVQGEIMQARSKKEELLDMNFYLRKSYFKTASLICASCKCAALLNGYDEKDTITIAAEEFGYHLGMAYQIIDDILDFTGASASLGKPAQADMQLGLATAPILYASEIIPELRPIIQRRFKEKGDVQKAVELTASTDAVTKSYSLAEFHAQRGVDAILRLPPSDARSALLKILHLALARQS